MGFPTHFGCLHASPVSCCLAERARSAAAPHNKPAPGGGGGGSAIGFNASATAAAERSLPVERTLFPFPFPPSRAGKQPWCASLLLGPFPCSRSVLWGSGQNSFHSRSRQSLGKETRWHWGSAIDPWPIYEIVMWLLCGTVASLYREHEGLLTFACWKHPIVKTEVIKVKRKKKKSKAERAKLSMMCPCTVCVSRQLFLRLTDILAYKFN